MKRTMVGEVVITVTGHSEAQPDQIIEIIRDWRRLPQFWHGMRSIRETRGQMLEVKFAFPGSAMMSYICDGKSQSCVENYHSGPFSGFKKIELIREGNGTMIRVRWEIKLSLSMILLKGFLKRHFTEGTESAIARICSEAESSVLQEEPIRIR